jgi:hypothetical protein
MCRRKSKYFEELQKVSRCPQTGTNSVSANLLQFAQPVLKIRSCRGSVSTWKGRQAEDTQR